MQTLTSTQFVRLELSDKILTLPEQRDIMLNSITQTREKCDSHVLGRPGI